MVEVAHSQGSVVSHSVGSYAFLIAKVGAKVEMMTVLFGWEGALTISSWASSLSTRATEEGIVKDSSNGHPQ